MQSADPRHSTSDPEYTLSSIVLRVSGSSLALPWVFSSNCHSLLPSGILCQVRSSSLLSTSEGVLSWISPAAFVRTRLSTVFDRICSSSSMTYVSPASIIASGGRLIVADSDEVLISKLLMLMSPSDGLYSSTHSFPSSYSPGGLSSISFIMTAVLLVVREGEEEGDEGEDEDEENGEGDGMLALLLLLLLSLLLSLLLPPPSLSCGKLLLRSSSSSPLPSSSMSVTLPKRSTISLLVIILGGGVFCPYPLGMLPPAAIDSSSSNNAIDTETFRIFIDIIYTVSYNQETFWKF